MLPVQTCDHAHASDKGNTWQLTIDLILVFVRHGELVVSLYLSPSLEIFVSLCLRVRFLCAICTQFQWEDNFIVCVIVCFFCFCGWLWLVVVTTSAVVPGTAAKWWRYHRGKATSLAFVSRSFWILVVLLVLPIIRTYSYLHQKLISISDWLFVDVHRPMFYLLNNVLHHCVLLSLKQCSNLHPARLLGFIFMHSEILFWLCLENLPWGDCERWLPSAKCIPAL